MQTLKFSQKLAYQPFFIRLLHWEYWPFAVIYGPLLIYWLWLSIKSRSLFFFNAANPTIENGGLMNESKFEIYRLLPNGYYPRTVYLKKGCSVSQATYLLEQASLRYPLIAKPDVGAKGRLVAVIEDVSELSRYCEAIDENFLLQEMIHWQNEVGIFYYRYPGQQHGDVSGIVEKQFLSVTGDGISTIELLLKDNKRYRLQLASLNKMYGSELQQVLRQGENKVLVPIGNHARGAEFHDVSFQADEPLVSAVDRVCRQIPGFYFGRLDIRFRSWDDLRNGQFSIIELNGAGSEPTHIYDPHHSIFYAWREILRHWNILQRISSLNHDRRGVPYLSFREGLQMFRASTRHGDLMHTSPNKTLSPSFSPAHVMPD